MNAGLELLGFEITFPVIVLGAITGMTYGILGVGLVLVHRSNRIINFAHGEVGAFAAAVFGVVVLNWSVPYWLMFPVAMAIGAAVSLLAEVAVIRRLRHAPRLMSVVATLGVGQFLQVFSLVVNSQAGAGAIYPRPSLLPQFDVGALRVTPAYSGMLLLTPLLVAAIVVFLRRHRYGKAMRGAAANAEAARLAGISPSRMSALAWAIAGAVSAFTAILFLPTQGFVSQTTFGPSLLLRALVAAVIARMTSLPVALGAGLGLGIVEQLLLWNTPSAGLVQAVLFLVIVVALLLQRDRGGTRERERDAWATVLPWRPLPDHVRSIPSIRRLPVVVGTASLAVAALLTLVVTNAVTVTLTAIVAFAIVGLSVGLITGLGGQLTLGQFAIAAIGALASFNVASRTGSFVLAFVVAGLVAGAASLVIGMPALRIRGLMLTVTTLAFALAVPSWILEQPWALGELGVRPGRPVVLDTELVSAKAYYLYALVWLVVAWWLARNVRRGALGRRLVAVRDNEDAARSFTVPATAVKLQAFVFSGFLAGIGGAVYGHSLTVLGNDAFPLRTSIDIAVMAVLGGIGLLSGPIIGALYVIGVPAFLPLDSAGLAATRLGALILILYAPGGLVQFVTPLRDRLVARLAARAGVPLEADPTSEVPASDVPGSGLPASVAGQPTGGVPTASGSGARSEPVVLTATDLRRHFGGVRAVDGLDLEVRRGEVLGLIGPNGAGKTTLFELLGGFTSPDTGSIRYEGQDITAWSPEQRGRQGLIRSFQDAALFPTMTVLEAIMLAHERIRPTRLLPEVLGLRRDEVERRRAASELVARMGLLSYRDKQIRELSTGTRRITELACLVALQPEVLLLDEPASGIAQRETEALGDVLRGIKQDFDLTLVVIEHDIPLIMDLADRIVAMDAGRVIADGTPQQVRHDPAVIDSYLGGDITAIERSGTAPTAT